MTVAVVAHHQVGEPVAGEVAGEAGGGRIAAGREGLDLRAGRAQAGDQRAVVRPGIERGQSLAEPVEIAQEQRGRSLADGNGRDRLRLVVEEPAADAGEDLDVIGPAVGHGQVGLRAAQHVAHDHRDRSGVGLDPRPRNHRPARPAALTQQHRDVVGAGVGDQQVGLAVEVGDRQSGGVGADGEARGATILRVEDTDLERSEARFEDQLIGDLKWLGLDWDEGPDVGGPYAPYRQSDRLEIYREHAERLLNEGKAYLCFCTEEDLQKERDRLVAAGGQPIYSGKCRSIEPAEAQRRRAAGEGCAIRLRIPEHPIRFHDIVHGHVEFSNEVVSDPIILRSSGMPVYNYVVVIDDALMKITHVIRGDDHISNTPNQVALYEALGWPVPEFAHLSTILGADRERLSKRHGATSMANFRDMGVLPEALVNYLALLGWAPSGGTREIFSLKELVKEFSLERITPSAAVFDMEKLYWLNRQYMKQRLAGLGISVTYTGANNNIPADAVGFPFDALTRITAEDMARISRLAEVTASLSPQAQLLTLFYYSLAKAGYLPTKADGSIWRWEVKLTLLLAYVDIPDQAAERARSIFDYDAKAAIENPDNAEVLAWPQTNAVLCGFMVKVLEDESAQAGQLAPEQFKKLVNEVKAETGTKGKELFHPIRIVITGSHSGPDFDRLIPILEEGSHLALPKHVLSTHQRVEEFCKVSKLH